MLSLNKVILAGKLVKILPRKETKSMVIQEIEIEIEESYFSKQNNCEETKTYNVQVTFFGKTAEIAGGIPLLSTVMVEGTVGTDTFKTKTGVDFTTTKVKGSKLTFEPLFSYRKEEAKTQELDLGGFDDDIPF